MLILPSYSLDSSSMTGPIARQGPHHSAQKSTTVNLSEEITLSWKLVSVNSKGIIQCFLCYVFILLIQMSAYFTNLFVVPPTMAVIPPNSTSKPSQPHLPNPSPSGIIVPI